LVVNADSNQMRQVLLNLLHNSAEAMAGQEGTRCIKIAGEMYLSQQAVKALPFATLSVTDNGPGISPITAAGIFEPFSTSKTQGTGLGLAISYRIMEAHNGSITCETPLQGGCRFVVRLPVLGKPENI
jgi:signal transduction histidine kinase